MSVLDQAELAILLKRCASSFETSSVAGGEARLREGWRAHMERLLRELDRAGYRLEKTGVV